MTPLLLLAALASTAPTSGEYDALKLAFSGGRVSGAFRESRMGNGTEAAPQFSCGFQLTGAWPAGATSAEVRTWWPGETSPDTRIAGRLTLRGGVATLKLKDNPGGCSMTGEDFAAGAGWSGDLSRARPWIEVREVRAGRSFFSPALGRPRSRSYVVEHDLVGVLARSGAWLNAEYVDGARLIRGWLPDGDLYPPVP